MIALQAIEMLQMQDRSNTLVHPQWREQGFDWGRAVFMESAELIEHMGWKWWKHQEPNLDQARMELVDIWHFGLSMVLEAAEGNVQAAALSIVEGWAYGTDRIILHNVATGELSPIDPHDVRGQAEMLASTALSRTLFLVPIFKAMCDALDVNEAQLYTLYMSKNALNEFRQAHGYKQGTYQKIWHGQEDNEVLTTLVDSLPHVSYESIYAALERAYKEVVR